MIDGVRIGPEAFLARQLFSATTSTKGRIVIWIIITSIARFLSVESHSDYKVSRSEWIKAAFELISFCKVEVRCLCWI